MHIKDNLGPLILKLIKLTRGNAHIIDMPFLQAKLLKNVIVLSWH